MSDSAIASYRAAKARLMGKISSLSGSTAEAKEYQNFLNTLSQLSGIQVSGNSESDQLIANAYDLIVKQIEEDLGVKLEAETLHLSEDSAVAASQIQTKEELAKANIFKKTATNTVSSAEVDKLLKQMDVIAKGLEGKSKKDLRAQEKRFLNYYDKIKQIVKSEAKAIGVGSGYVLPETLEGTNVPLMLNRAKAMINTASIAKLQGDIGELFVAYALSIYNNSTEKNVSKILNSFKKGQANVTVTGADASYNVYPKSIIDTPTFSLAAHATQDKVDVEMKAKDDRPVTFSVKNYGNPREVTLLSGNLGPLFNQYMDFMYHYYTLYQTPSAYQLAKNIAYFHALVGGIQVSAEKNNLNNLIVSGSAEYLAVNDSHRTNSFRVYSTAEIAKRYLTPGKKGDQIFKMTGAEALNNPSAYGDVFIDQLNRSNTHISLLLNSVKL